MREMVWKYTFFFIHILMIGVSGCSGLTIEKINLVENNYFSCR